ncbi:MAG: hypothetical protein R2941_03525 [Desulfobacterales bacterium]
MTTIQPQGEDIRRAVKWISEERKDHPEKDLQKLIDQACTQFDLSPAEADYLIRVAAQNCAGA